FELSLDMSSTPEPPGAAKAVPDSACELALPEDHAPLLRHSDVSFPARVRVGQAHNLRVQIIPAEVVLPTGEVRKVPKPHGHDDTFELKVPPPPSPGQPPPPVRVTVFVAAENFALESEPRAELVVPLAGKSAAAHFTLRGQEAGPGRIMVDFFQD